MKIALAQLNYTIGDFEGNTNKIIETILEVKQKGAELVVFSELSVCGYPPLDLLEHKYFIDKCEDSLQKIASASDDIGVIVGAPKLNSERKGKNLFNSALFFHNGKLHTQINKALLPTYDIFDEYRYFQPVTNTRCIDFRGCKIALTICEDLWYEQPLLTNFGKDKLYQYNPLKQLTEENPDIIINIAASPFAYNHDEIKSEILEQNAKKHQIPIYYVNQVGAHTELIFDGGSRVIKSNGETALKLPVFLEHIEIVDTDNLANQEISESDNKIAMIHDALVLGIKDYFVKMNFKTVVLGLSGGIDSAVTLVLAARALGNDKVRVLLLPSKYSSDHSVSDAVALAEKLNIQYQIVSIKDIVSSFDDALAPIFENLPPDVAEENIQARVRGTLLMAISNKFGNILLNTSNKSEAAVGYSTLYGDMNGGLSVLGDVYKTDVYELARYMNKDKEIIPVNTIVKPPSAELRPDQKDTDSLPDYDTLDAILYAYIELRQSKQEIIDNGHDATLVERIIRMVNNNEYKRFQTPPILRISSKAFGLGRRMPLVARY
ncbi:MAG: NAD+ synthase [Bacteroidales bacterium]|nr:NAD+ synthase [Bacteroidales bacterium]